MHLQERERGSERERERENERERNRERESITLHEPVTRIGGDDSD